MRFHPKFRVFTARTLVEKVVSKLNRILAPNQFEVEVQVKKSRFEKLYAYKSLIKNVLVNMLQSAFKKA